MSPSCAGDILAVIAGVGGRLARFQAMSPSCAGDIPTGEIIVLRQIVSSHVAELRWRHLIPFWIWDCFLTKFQAMSPSCAGDILAAETVVDFGAFVSSHVAELRWRHLASETPLARLMEVSSHVAELRWRHLGIDEEIPRFGEGFKPCRRAALATSWRSLPESEAAWPGFKPCRRAALATSSQRSLHYSLS